MKTPRELLLQRHADADSALNVVRQTVVQQLEVDGETRTELQAGIRVSFLEAFWQELFVACRQYWMGLSAAWCVIVLLAVIGHEGEVAQNGFMTPPSEVVIQAMQVQKQLRNELLGLEGPQQAQNVAHDDLMRPRSEAIVTFVAV